MKSLGRTVFGILAILAVGAVASAAEKSLDLRRAVPADVYLVVQHKYNPERDFQRAYFNEVWKTIEETKIVEHAVQIVVSRMDRDRVERAKAVLDELRAAAAPIKFEALANAQEVIYAQEMRPLSAEMSIPVVHHLVLVRLSPEAAASTQKGIENLFELVERYSAGRVPLQRSSEAGAEVVALALPRQVPFQPTVIRVGSVLLVSSSKELAHKSLDMLVGGKGKSKFDDPRLKEALDRLPQPEDGLVFYDMRGHMGRMQDLVGFIRAAGQNKSETQRLAGMVETIFDDVSILDHEVTVAYTEGNLNCSATRGKLAPNAENKTLFKVVSGGKPFTDWQGWVPANAVSYSLTTGANLHPLYERIIDTVKERFPEAEGALERFEKLQLRVGVHLDRDILQAFSGECVSISLPAAGPLTLGGGRKFLAMRCHQPDRIRRLLHTAVDLLKKIPPLAAQQVRFAKCEELDGFEQLSAVALTGLNVKPVIGFHEGWMMIASDAETVKAVLATKAGKSPSVADAPSFKQFHLKVDGAVQSIRYNNSAEDIRQTAAMLNQLGIMAPMILSMAAAQADQEKLKPVQELLALLPSAARIVSKFDFFEARLSIVEAGSEPGTYQKRSVTVIRPAAKQ